MLGPGRSAVIPSPSGSLDLRYRAGLFFFKRIPTEGSRILSGTPDSEGSAGAVAASDPDLQAIVFARRVNLPSPT